MANTIDARNIPCPEPVVMTKKALEKLSGGSLLVLVNTDEACQNVQRFAQNQGCKVTVTRSGNESTIEITKAETTMNPGIQRAPIMLIAGDQLGSGDESLGQLLIASLINAIPEAAARPSKMLFINRGVMLTTEGSRVLDTLQQLEKAGVQILSCGTCLNHYQLKEKLKVGQVTNMFDTVNSLLTAENVIRI